MTFPIVRHDRDEVGAEQNAACSGQNAEPNSFPSPAHQHLTLDIRRISHFKIWHISCKADSVQKTLFEFQPFADNDEINVFIETAKGSGSKFKYEPDLNLFSLHKSLPKGMEFPYDYGFIPSTLGEDGDPLDVLVLIDTDVFPGCLVKARLVGVIEAKQRDHEKEERNDRLVAVHVKSATWDDITELDDLPPGLIDQIEHFLSPITILTKSNSNPLAARAPNTHIN